MKIVKCILVLCLLLSASVSFGQKLKVQENHGEVFKPKTVNYLEVFKKSKSGYFSVSYVPRRTFMLVATLRAQYYIQQYDDDMNFLREIELDLSMYDPRFKYFNLLQFGDDFLVFVTKEDRANEQLELYVSTLNPESGQVSNKPYKIASAKYVPQKGYTYPSFKISISGNKSYLVVFSNDAQKIQRELRFGRNKNDEVGTYKFGFTFWLFDEDMKEVMHEVDYKLSVDNSTNEFYVQDFEVDDNGSIYILGKNAITDRLTRRERKETKTRSWVDIKQSAFVLEKINPDGSSKQQVTPEELLYLDMNILFDTEGNLNLIGLVGEQVYYKLAATGVNRLTLSSEDLEVLREQTTDFSEEVLENVNNVREARSKMNERKKKRVQRKEAKLTDEQKAYNEISKRAALNVNNIAYSGLDKDGNASVVLEECYVHVVTTTTRDANGGTTTTTTYYYHYDDLFLLKFFDNEIAQNSYNKEFTTINIPLDISVTVSQHDGELTIVTPEEIVRTDSDMEEIVDYKIKAMDYNVRVPGLRRKLISYKKVIDENTVVAPAQFKRKVAWYKFEVN